MAVMFDVATDMTPVDLYLVERYGWPIACPEAYPVVIHARLGATPRSPTAGELEFLVACLDCVPDFVASGEKSRVCPPSKDGRRGETRLRWVSDAYRRPVLRQRPASPSPAAPIRPPSRPEKATESPSTTTDPPPEPVQRQDATPDSSTAPISRLAAVQHVNRKLEIYYLHQGHTKTGEPMYFFSKKCEGDLCARLPDGFEVYENPRGQVFCRRIQHLLITEQEVEVVREAIRKRGMQFLAGVDVKTRAILVYEREDPCFKFSLLDIDKRLFAVSRWCFRGSIDGWLPLCTRPSSLPELAEKYCEHIGQDSFFELI